MHDYIEDLQRVRDCGIDWQEYCILQQLGRQHFESDEQFNTVAVFLIDLASGVENSPEEVMDVFFDGLHDGEFTLDDLDTEDGYMKVEGYVYENLE